MQRFTIIERGVAKSSFADDLARGLSSSPKSIPPVYFYDALGSALFDAICHLPEYYPARCDTEILTTYAAEIAERFGRPLRLIELGSGTARKTRLLLDAITASVPDLEYVPVDVDAAMLEAAGRDLLNEYPQLRVTAICADFRSPSAALASVVRPDVRNVVLFLGSTIGNLTHEEAVEMLADLRGCLAPGDALFLGTDLRKSAEILEPAYDDPVGVTAAFNRNVLQRANRELGADFDVKAFEHRAFYDAVRGRVEMHLVSMRDQDVHIGDVVHHFEQGETIHTENSWKYDEKSIEAIAREGGFAVDRRWTDSQGWFADTLLIR